MHIHPCTHAHMHTYTIQSCTFAHAIMQSYNHAITQSTHTHHAQDVDRHGISTIVSKCSHVDHISLDLDVVVTEEGLADLRGLTPRDKVPCKELHARACISFICLSFFHSFVHSFIHPFIPIHSYSSIDRYSNTPSTRRLAR